jgi:hypothetical protein
MGDLVPEQQQIGGQLRGEFLSHDDKILLALMRQVGDYAKESAIALRRQICLAAYRQNLQLFGILGIVRHFHPR